MVANRSLQPTVARYADRMWLRSNVVKQSRHSYSTHHRQVRVVWSRSTLSSSARKSLWGRHRIIGNQVGVCYQPVRSASCDSLEIAGLLQLASNSIPALCTDPHGRQHVVLNGDDLVMPV